MSKGEIISHIGEGKYRVRQKLAVERIQQEVTRLSERIAQLAIDLPTAQLELLQAENAVKDTVRDINLLIPDYMAGVEGARARINKLQAELVPLQSAAKQAQLRVSELIAENLAILKRRNQLEAVPEGRELEVWCADYTLDLTGDVGLVDVNDEGGQGVVIQPGYDGEGVYDQARDGAMFPGLAQSGIQLYFNAAILPGVQKWMPRYRIGTISKIESDTCRVELDEATSSAQGLSINQESVLEGVPIKYMDCNGAAFEDGERVLVRFTKNGPLVVGFAEHPKDCGLPGIVTTPAQSRGFWSANYYGPDFETDQGVPINPPLGQSNSYESAWIFNRPSANSFGSYTKGNPRLYGMRNWLGRGAEVVSWHGPPSRNCWLLREDMSKYNVLFPAYSSEVFYRSSKICDLNFVDVLPADCRMVEGAAIVYLGSERDRYLRVCASNTDDGVAVEWTTIFYKCHIVDIPWPGSQPDIANATIVASHEMTAAAAPMTGMYFSASGGKATQCLSPSIGSVTVLRFAEGQGISVDTIDSQAIATGTITFQYRSLYEKIGSIPERELTIGYEYVGETENEVKIVIPAYSESIIKSRNETLSSHDGILYSPSDTGTVSGTISQAPVKIMFGDQVLFESDRGVLQLESEQHSYSANPSGPSSFGQSTGTYSANNTISADTVRTNGMVVDARHGMIALEYVEVDSSGELSMSISQGSGARLFSGSYEQTGTRSSESRTEVSYRVYRNGSEVGRIESAPQFTSSGGPTTGQFQAVFLEVGQPGTVNYTPTNNFTPPSHPYINLSGSAGLSRIRQASMAASGSAYLAGFEWLREGDFEPICMTLSSAGDLVASLMQRDPANSYLFANISLI